MQKTVTINSDGMCLIDGIVSTQSNFPGDASSITNSSLYTSTGFDMSSKKELVVDMVVLYRGV